MLNSLKKEMQSFAYSNDSILAENMAGGTDDSIRNMFLDDPDAIVIGSENDPAIKKLVDMIPEAEETEDVDEKDISKLVENLVPEINLEATDFNSDFDTDDVDLVSEGNDFDDFIDDDIDDDESVDDSDDGLDVSNDMLDDIIESSFDFDDVLDTAKKISNSPAAVGDDEFDDADFDELTFNDFSAELL